MNVIPDVPAGTGLYPIVDVEGRRPDILTDFLGAVTITISVAGEPRRLVGSGDLTYRGVEFRQQNRADIDGSNVRLWTIAEDGNGIFWAEPLATWVMPARE